MKRGAMLAAGVLGMSLGLVALSGDFNGDGTNDIGIFRRSSGLWAIRGVTRCYFGTLNDEPRPGDYDGDGKINIAVFRPSSGLWAVRGLTRVYFGASTDESLAGIPANFWSCQSAAGISYCGGYVGIGKSVPAVELDIFGSSPKLRLTGEELGYDASVIEFWSADRAGMSIGYYPLEMKMIIRDDRRNADLVQIGEGSEGGATIDVLAGIVNIGHESSLVREQFSVKMSGAAWEDRHFALVASSSNNKWDFTVGSSDRLYVGFNENSLFYVTTAGSLRMENGSGGYYDVTTHSWVNGSTRAIKQDIKPNEMDIEAILDRVNIVNYRFKQEVAEDKSAPYHIGFIAEETPELLSGRERNGMITGDCIGLLLAAVKEQQKTISSLEAKVARLEERLP